MEIVASSNAFRDQHHMKATLKVLYYLALLVALVFLLVIGFFI
jgi:hypothetical protein